MDEHPYDHAPGSGHLHDHDRGLLHDLPLLVGRRRTLTLLAGAGLVGLAGCGVLGGGGTSGGRGTDGGGGDGGAEGGATSTSADATSDGGSEGGSSCGAAIPEETGGPYPANGSNGVNVLGESGVVRSDIRGSFGGSSMVAEGVALTVRLTVLDLANGCGPLPGVAVYLWHCDREGRYSLYSDGVAGENYLRGVQAANSAGVVSFTSIFPAAYMGRWPHIHFEVYPSVEEATSAGSKLVTSQLAFPADVCEAVYATDGYEQSVRNLAETSLDSDMVFGDGYSRQLATVTGDVLGGYAATLTVPV